MRVGKVLSQKEALDRFLSVRTWTFSMNRVVPVA